MLALQKQVNALKSQLQSVTGERDILQKQLFQEQLAHQLPPPSLLTQASVEISKTASTAQPAEAAMPRVFANTSEEIAFLKLQVDSLNLQLNQCKKYVETAAKIQKDTHELKANFQATLEMLKLQQVNFAEEKWRRQKRTPPPIYPFEVSVLCIYISLWFVVDDELVALRRENASLLSELKSNRGHPKPSLGSSGLLDLFSTSSQPSPYATSSSTLSSSSNSVNSFDHSGELKRSSLSSSSNSVGSLDSHALSQQIGIMRDQMHTALAQLKVVRFLESACWHVRTLKDVILQNKTKIDQQQQSIKQLQEECDTGKAFIGTLNGELAKTLEEKAQATLQLEQLSVELSKFPNFVCVDPFFFFCSDCCLPCSQRKEEVSFAQK